MTDKRASYLHRFFLLLFCVIFVRLWFWQIIKGPELSLIASQQYDRTSLTSFRRANIFSADGYPLVLNEQKFSLYVRPKALNNPLLTLAALESVASHVASPASYLLPPLARLGDKERVLVGKMLSSKDKSEIDKLSLNGLEFDPLYARSYPEASMAAHLLGFVGQDDLGKPVGYYGVEGEYDLELKGKQSRTLQETDVLGKPISIGKYEEIEGVEPRDLHLTLRRDLQYIVEKALEKGVERYGAKSADAIIMDPKTGKILALGIYPSFEPAKYRSYDLSVFRNQIIADAYEPGSTMKVVTVASGIEAGVIGPDTPCTDCGAPKTIGKYTIKTWNNEYTPNITMRDALAKSDNTAMMFVADKLGKDRYVQFLKKFGFGQKTDVDLQGEIAPALRPDAKWGDIDLATSSFGQGIAVTGIEMLDAVGAIANKGVRMRPFVVEKVVSSSEEFVTKPKVLGLAISEKTAETVTNMMIDSANHGDAHWALPKGYTIAGKTGTAQIPVEGHYDDKRTIASFVGFAPAYDPQFVMLVRVLEPTTSQWGSETAAPLWFAIAKELFLKLGIPPQ